MGKKSRGKQQKNHVMQVAGEQTVTQNVLALVVFVGLCVLLFYPPYFRAMFFTKEQLPTHLLTYILFILWWVVKYQRKDVSFLREPLDYLVFGFVLAFVLSFTVAINIRGAIQEFLKVGNYFLVYWLVMQLSQTKKEAHFFLNVLVLSALGVAVLGLGAAAGTWEVVGGYMDGRIYSTIQYPNSLAAYLTGAFLVCLSLWQTTTWKLRQFYAVAAFLLLITAILTYSRGGWLIMPVFFSLYLIFLPRGRRLEAALFIGLLSAVSTGLTPFAGRVALADQDGRLWLLIFAGCLVVLAGQYLLVDLRKRLSPKFLWATTALLALLFFGVVGGYVYGVLAAPLHVEQTSIEQLVAVAPEVQHNLTMEVLATGLADAPFAWQLTVLEQHQDASVATLLQEQGQQSLGWEAKEFTFSTSKEAHRLLIQLQSVHPGTAAEFRGVTLVGADRTLQLGFGWNRLLPGLLYTRLFGMDRERNVAERFVFFKDAWEIIKDHPWRGLGGHGWSSIYFQYQSAPYSTTEVHNHFLQVWIETGVLGFLIFVGLWLGLIFMSYRLYRRAEADEKVLIVGITAGVLAVVAHSLYDFNLSLGALGLFVFALMGVARSFVPKNVVRANQSELYKPVLAVSMAFGLMIFVFRLMIGNMAFDEGIGQMRRGQLDQAMSSLERAVQYDPFDPQIRLALAEGYEAQGRQAQNIDYLAKAKEQYQAAFNNNRYNPRYAHALGSFLVRASLFEQGFGYLQQAITLHPRMAVHQRVYADAGLRAAYVYFENNDRITAEMYLERVFASERQVRALFGDTSSMALSVGQAYFLLGDYEQAMVSLKKALNVGEDKAHASMMLALIHEKKGDSVRAKVFYDQGIGIDPASEGVYQYFKEF